MKNRTLRKILIGIIEKWTELEFNKRIEEIFQIVYKDEFVSIKQKRDLGSDGIIESEKITLACYAPERYELKKYKKKIKDDCEKYRNHYQHKYKLRFITNQEIRAEVKATLEEECPDAEIWGVNELVTYILKGVSASKRRRILKDVFELDDEEIAFDIIEEIVEEILEGNYDQIETKNISYKTPLDLYKKIEKNFKNENYIEMIKKKTEDIYPEYAILIHKIIEALDENLKTTLKNRIINEYYESIESLSNKPFEFIYNKLINRFASKYPDDDEYRKGVEMLLLYIFEQCLLGKS